jgi:hypothetical protein
MTQTSNAQTTTDAHETTGDVVRVPALGLSYQTVMCLIVGLLFAAAGAAFEILFRIQMRNVDAPWWIFHGFLGLCIAVGLLAMMYGILDIFRRFEFRADASCFERKSIFGPFRRARQFRRATFEELRCG